MDSTSGTSLKQMFQGMIPETTSLLQGVVTSTNPLRIQMVNDSKLVISKLSAVIPKHLTDYSTNITIKESSKTINATMTVYNALKVGDRVHLLAMQDGKKYFVLDRV